MRPGALELESIEVESAQHDRFAPTAMERPSEELDLAVDQEKVELAGFIRKQHDELRRTFDPSVVRLRKRRKILVHKNAFDDLE